jgi:phosphoglycolate phosphatase
MLRAAMSAAGVGPEQTVMVGDSLFDIQMAQAAGIPSLAVAWGFCPPEDLRAAGAVAILERFDEVEAILGEIGSAAA